MPFLSPDVRIYVLFNIANPDLHKERDTLCYCCTSGPCTIQEVGEGQFKKHSYSHLYGSSLKLGLIKCLTTDRVCGKKLTATVIGCCNKNVTTSRFVLTKLFDFTAEPKSLVCLWFGRLKEGASHHGQWSSVCRSLSWSIGHHFCPRMALQEIKQETRTVQTVHNGPRTVLPAGLKLWPGGCKP